MIDYARLATDLAAIAHEEWVSALTGLCREKLSSRAHGNLAGWLETLASLPNVARQSATLDATAIRMDLDWSEGSMAMTRDALMTLSPWRKGPFDIGGIGIDAEWRSNLKWDRLKNAIAPLKNRNVLDVGCGNGYYSLRMRGAGAKIVLGIDPTLLFVVQFAALTNFMKRESVHVLPLRLHELPPSPPLFDTVFSMGVLYHQREPLQHLAQLKKLLTRDGELVLETLIVPGDESTFVVPEDRYARMRNVWHLPTLPRLREWLGEAGFSATRAINQTATGSSEQRTTEWMTFDSLAAALCPSDTGKTIEGLPAPLRLLMVCRP